MVRRRAASSSPRTRRSAGRSLALVGDRLGRCATLSGHADGRRRRRRRVVVAGVGADRAARARERCSSRWRCAATARRCRGPRSSGPSVPHPLHGAADCGRGDRRRRAASGSARRAAPSPRAIAVARGRRATSCGRSIATAPMVLEAQWDRPNSAASARGHRLPARAATTARRSWRAWDRSATTCRRRRATASTSAISCTKATATSGWRRSNGPRRYAGWMLIEEKAEGGDMLARARARAPDFLDGYRRVCEGARRRALPADMARRRRTGSSAVR